MVLERKGEGAVRCLQHAPRSPPAVTPDAALLFLVNTARLYADLTFSLCRFSLSSLKTLAAAVLVAVRGPQILQFV